eukprot:TRINITY_DN3429_c0_g1_i1.p1 TRINITY_DN3429_c0_g1~~TRINITY_DN3429_c0_g1_i1.p1  ORF type:complete len:250 (-),score=37.74 TRINITY_DN3429_c0_g1_i1:186-935(-)
MEHHLSSENLACRKIALDIIDYSIKILSRDPGNLLAIVHKIWDPLKYRFTDENFTVSLKSMKIMETLSIHCKEFLNRKFSDDLWPSLKEEIDKHNPKYIGNFDINYQTQYSNFSGAVNLLKYSESHKLQVSILNCLRIACKYINCRTNDFYEMVESTLFYLGKHQPKDLQKGCIKLYIEFINFDPDYMWYTLVDIGNIKYHNEAPLFLSRINMEYQERLDIMDNLKQLFNTKYVTEEDNVIYDIEEFSM